jgi:hypothetical protein
MEMKNPWYSLSPGQLSRKLSADCLSRALHQSSSLRRLTHGCIGFFYDSTTSSTDPFVPGACVNVPILDAQFGYTGVTSNLAYVSTNGWYWLDIVPNTFFSCAAAGFNTVYCYANGYSVIIIGMQPTGGK